MRLDPTLASSVVLADQSVVSFIALTPACFVHEGAPGRHPLGPKHNYCACAIQITAHNHKGSRTI